MDAGAVRRVSEFGTRDTRLRYRAHLDFWRGVAEEWMNVLDHTRCRSANATPWVSGERALVGHLAEAARRFNPDLLVIVEPKGERRSQRGVISDGYLDLLVGQGDNFYRIEAKYRHVHADDGRGPFATLVSRMREALREARSFQEETDIVVGAVFTAVEARGGIQGRGLLRDLMVSGNAPLYGAGLRADFYPEALGNADVSALDYCPGITLHLSLQMDDGRRLRRARAGSAEILPFTLRPRSGGADSR